MMRSYYKYFWIFLTALSVTAGCSGYHESIRSARASFPLKFFYHPTYETIGAMYKSSPSLAIELLERLTRKGPHDLAYKLTLSDMYRDSGRVNDSIRLWFEILEASKEMGIVDGKDLLVYYIPIVPDQEEGMGPYRGSIDKSLAYYNIGLIYLRNTFYQEASDSFSRAAENTQDPERQAELYYRAGLAMGLKKAGSSVLQKDEIFDNNRGDTAHTKDPLKFRRREMAFYEKALSLDFTDSEFREEIENKRSALQEEMKQDEEALLKK